jgi:hypothetical protein
MTEDEVAYILLLGGCDTCKHRIEEKHMDWLTRQSKIIFKCFSAKRMAGTALHPMHMCRWWEDKENKEQL